MDWIRRLPKRPKATTMSDFAVRSLRPGWSILKMPLSDLDQQLIDRCLNHEEGSWLDFVDRYLGLVFHVVRHTAHSRSMTLSFVDVEDVAAEILLELVKNDYSALRQFKGLSSFPAYLTVISRRICIRQLIKLRRESVLGHVNAHRTVVDGSSVEIEPVLATEEVACFVPGDQGGTYNGNALMTAVGISVIEQLLAPGFLDEVIRKGELLSRELQTLATEFNLEGERGKGLLRALMLGKDVGPKLVEMARDQGPEGLLINSPRPNLLRFMPSLAVTDAEIKQMCGMLRGLLQQTH